MTPIQSLFTIIIPTYKRPTLLKRAIESALKQTWSNTTVLVLDNASQDGTKEVVDSLKKNDPRIEYICHDKNIGMLGQYLYGIEHVKTEFFSFLSDDDYLLPSFCEVSVHGLMEFPDCCFFASSTLIVSEKSKILRIPIEEWPCEGRYEPLKGACEMVGKYPVPTTVAFRKSYASKITIDVNNSTGWDCDFLLQLACKYPIAITKKVTGVFINHPQSFTSFLGFNQVKDSIVRIIERIAHLPFKDSLIPLLESNLLQITKSYAKTLAFKKDYGQSLCLAKELKKSKTFSSQALFAIIRVLQAFPWLHFSLIFAKKIAHFQRRKIYKKFEENLKIK